MTLSVKHKFTSPKGDGVDSTLVQPSNWNDTHNMTAAAGQVLGTPVGSTTVQELPIVVDATLQSMIPPAGTTAQRPATGVAGMFRYNTSLNRVELYNGTAWGSVGGGATVSGTAPTSPQTGDFWYDSTNTLLKTWNGSAWVLPSPNASVVRQQFTATAGQTSFTITGGYSPGNVDVYQNGVKLVNGTDVTITSGTAVVLITGAAAGDAIEVVGSANAGTAYLPTTGGTLSGTLNIASGTLQIAGNKAVNGPAFSAYQSAAQTLATSTTTKVQFQTKEFDTDTNYDATTNYRFTPTTAGYYKVEAGIQYNTTSTACLLQLYKNGALYKNLFYTTQTVPGGYGSALVYLNGSTDYIEIFANISSGQALAATVSGTYFQAAMVRGA